MFLWQCSNPMMSVHEYLRILWPFSGENHVNHQKGFILVQFLYFYSPCLNPALIGPSSIRNQKAYPCLNYTNLVVVVYSVSEIAKSAGASPVNETVEMANLNKCHAKLFCPPPDTTRRRKSLITETVSSFSL